MGGGVFLNCRGRELLVSTTVYATGIIPTITDIMTRFRSQGFGFRIPDRCCSRVKDTALAFQ